MSIHKDALFCCLNDFANAKEHVIRSQFALSILPVQSRWIQSMLLFIVPTIRAL